MNKWKAKEERGKLFFYYFDFVLCDKKLTGVENEYITL